MLMSLCSAALIAAPLIEITKLSSDYPCYVAEDASSQVVTITFAFKTSGQIGETKPGLLLALVAMLSEGAGEMDQEVFKKYLLDHNIEPYFSFDQDHLYLTFRTESKKISELLKCAELLFTSPRFHKDDLIRIKQQVIANLSQMAHMPQLKAMEAFKDFALEKKHPYNRTIREQIDTIKSLTADHLKEAWKQCIEKGRLVVAASGDINKQNTKLLQGFLKNINLPEGNPLTFQKEFPLNNLGKVRHVKEDIPQTVIMFSLPSLDRAHPDFDALQFAIQAFASGGFETRLMTEIRDKRGLAYGVGAQMVTYKMLKVILGNTATNTDNAQKVIEIIKKELKKLVDHGLTQDEFKFHQDFLMGGAPLKVSTTMQINAQIIASACDGLDPAKHVNSMQKRYGVLTLQKVNEVIQKHIHPEQLIVLSLGRGA